MRKEGRDIPAKDLKELGGLGHALSELYNERDLADDAIGHIEKLQEMRKSDSIKESQKAGSKRGRTKPLTEAEKLSNSEQMRDYWEGRKRPTRLTGK